MRGPGVMVVVKDADAAARAAGGALPRYAAGGARTYLVLATLDGADVVGLSRTARAAGVRETFGLGFDGAPLDEVDPAIVVQRIVEHIRLVRPDVVVAEPDEDPVLDPEGAELAERLEDAVTAAADPRYRVPSGRRAHRARVAGSREDLLEAHAQVA